jgi:hypothetical protein
MAKRRTNKHRGALNSYEQAWLEGDRKVGFLYSLNHGFIRQELWDRAGDHENFHWNPSMRYPEPLAKTPQSQS